MASRIPFEGVLRGTEDKTEVGKGECTPTPAPTPCAAGLLDTRDSSSSAALSLRGTSGVQYSAMLLPLLRPVPLPVPSLLSFKNESRDAE